MKQEKPRYLHMIGVNSAWKSITLLSLRQTTCPISRDRYARCWGNRETSDRWLWGGSGGGPWRPETNLYSDGPVSNG